MPNAEVTQLWLQLGVAGATLLILLTFGILFFKFIGNYNRTIKGSEDNKVDKLCDKIDILVNTIAEDRKAQAETRVANEKDQKLTVDLLGSLMANSNRVLEKVTRIETQTANCIHKENRR